MNDIDNEAYSGHEQLKRIEDCLPRYNASIVQRFSQALPKGVQAVLDYGAGIGTLTQLFTELTGIKPSAYEIDPQQAQILQARGFLTHSRIENLGQYELIYSSNVLEHIEDDLGALKVIRTHLTSQGLLLLYLPAFELLWSVMDDKVGHFRRYTKKSLSKRLNAAGFRVVSSQYCDSIGFLASLYLKLRKNSGESEASLKIYDRFIWPASRLLDKLGLRFWLGKNLFVVAQLSTADD